MLQKGQNNYDVQCYICSSQWNAEIVLSARVVGCPKCGTQIPPMRLYEFGYVHVNWQDIRVLAIYAQRWVETFRTDREQDKGNREAVITLNKIIEKLYKFKPPTGGNLDPDINHPVVKEAIEERKVRGIPSPFFKKQQ